jgi:hypothetical protein
VWDLPVQDCELVAEDEDLGVFRTIASAAQHEQVDDQASEAIRSSKHGQILAASDRDSPITTML